MIYFFSDSHIGSRAIGNLDARLQHQQKVIRMIEMMSRDAEEIHILGDLFDFWYEYLWPDRAKEEYTPLLDTLRTLTDRGIRIHFYIGNHDMWTFGWLARRTGMTVHRNNVQPTTCYGRRILLGHGDGLVPDNYLEVIPKEYHSRIRRFIWLRRWFHNPIPQQAFRILPPTWGNRFGYEWSRKSRLKEQANPCPYKGENKEEVVLWAKHHSLSHSTQSSPEDGAVDYYIFGHRHIELDLELVTGAHVIILGDTWQQWTYGRLAPDGTFSLEVYDPSLNG